jgi:hypothetical protein
MGLEQPPAGDGHIRLTVQSSLLGRSKLGVYARVDDEPVKVTYGENVIAAAAGRHRVEGYVVFAAEYGHASVDVEVPAGGEARAFYAPPFLHASPGRMGLTPQQPPGRWWVYLFCAILVLGLIWTMLT